MASSMRKPILPLTALASLVMASYAASDNWDNTMAPTDDETNDRNKKR